MARLRSVAQLERAMKARDVNGRELARAAETSAQTVSQLRTGDRLRVQADTARRLERALRVERGSLFCVDRDDQPGILRASHRTGGGGLTHTEVRHAHPVSRPVRAGDTIAAFAATERSST